MSDFRIQKLSNPVAGREQEVGERPQSGGGGRG